MTNQELEFRALKILEQQPELTQRQLSEELGVSLGKTNYLLTPMGVAEKAAITLRFLKRKKQEYNDLQSEIAQLQQEVQQQQLQQEIQQQQ